MKRKLCFTMVLLVLFALGVNFAPALNAEDDVLIVDTTEKGFERFEEMVDVHIGMSVSPIDKTLPAGDSADNNQYTRYLLENFNINVIADWTAAEGNDYNQKVSLAIGSNTLPDAMIVNDRTYMTKAASANMLYDLTDLFEEYQSDQVRTIMETTEGRAMENATYEGKMVGLPNITPAADGIHVLMIRQDWLDELGLEPPKTIADVGEVARAFVEAGLGGENTIGIQGPDKSGKPYATFLQSGTNSYGFDPIFQALDVYPGYWLENDEGEVYYGSLDPKMKDALQILQDWYNEGLIDPEMGARDSAGEPINAGQAGIMFSAWWQLGYGNSDAFINDPTANWQAYPLYDDEGNWNVHMKNVGELYTIVNKDVSEEVAKAVIVMNNALIRDEALFDVSVAIGWYPLRNVMAPLDESEHTYRQLEKILKGEASPEDYQDERVYKLLADDAAVVQEVINSDLSEQLSVADFNMDDFGSFKRMYAIMIGDRPYATTPITKAVDSITYNQTPLMERRWPNLQSLEEETMLKIIVGQASVDEFDNFVADWLAQGGEEITEEVANLK